MSDDLDVLARLIDYHDHIAAPAVSPADDVRRGRRRVLRRRRQAVGVATLAVATTVVTAFLAAPTHPDGAPEPAEPTPTVERTQSARTWADTPVEPQDGYGWAVPDGLQAARDAWRDVVVDHLDTSEPHLGEFESAPHGTMFVRPPVGSIHATYGRIGLITDDSGLDPLDGCRYVATIRGVSGGTESCEDERLVGPHGERVVVAERQRRCGAYEGGGPADAECGDYRVVVAVARRDSTIGYVDVDGRGTSDFNPFSASAMAAAAADPRLTLPASVTGVPGDQVVAAVVTDLFPAFRVDGPEVTPPATGHPGLGVASGHVGRLGLRVEVFPAGEEPVCGRSWLLECIERRVYGYDDPTTVWVGAWDEDDWAGCCPRNSRADSRVFVHVGPRNTVVVRELMVVRAHEDPISARLDKRMIDLALDARLQRGDGTL